jgi:hypothetical protein
MFLTVYVYYLTLIQHTVWDQNNFFSTWPAEHFFRIILASNGLWFGTPIVDDQVDGQENVIKLH